MITIELPGTSTQRNHYFRIMKAHFIATAVALVWFSLGTVLATCPANIRAPCTCATTRYEPVSIVCDRGASLGAVLQASDVFSRKVGRFVEDC